MSEQQYTITVDGQEVTVTDLNNLGRTSGLAGDRALAWLMTLPVYDGTNVYKTVTPSGTGFAQSSGGATPKNSGIVIPAGATGSVTINPFTALIGTRTAAGTSPTDPTWTGPRQNLSDIRTSIWTGTTTLTGTQALSANSSGNARWDLVYATVSVDVNAGAVTRRQKAASTGVVSVGSFPTYLANPVTVGVVTGTPGASPALPSLPSLPADSGGNYNVAIAAVRVPNGFSSSSTVSSRDIRDLVGDKNLTNGGGQTRTRLTGSTGAMTGPASATGNNDLSATIYTNFGWSTTAGTRPSLYLPPSMAGGHQVIAEVDTVSSPSHTSGSVVDDSIDWRNRFIKVAVSASGGGPFFANDPTFSGGSNIVPAFGTSINTTVVGQSFAADAALVASSSTVWSQSGAPLPGGSVVGLYVLASDGVLRWYANGTSSVYRFFFWLTASSAFPNA